MAHVTASPHPEKVDDFLAGADHVGQEFNIADRLQEREFVARRLAPEIVLAAAE